MTEARYVLTRVLNGSKRWMAFKASFGIAYWHDSPADATLVSEVEKATFEHDWQKPNDAVWEGFVGESACTLCSP